MSYSVEATVSALAAAIGEPARVRILFCLMDGRERTSTELATVAAVSPSTASMHLGRLKEQRLVAMRVRGKHHYYRLQGPAVVAALRELTAFAGESHAAPNPSIRASTVRPCYDHMAGRLAVGLHDRFRELGWLASDARKAGGYVLTFEGEAAFEDIGIDLSAARALRRRFACACVDWSEERPHLGGALGAALLRLALDKGWVTHPGDSPTLCITQDGRRELLARFDLDELPD